MPAGGVWGGMRAGFGLGVFGKKLSAIKPKSHMFLNLCTIGENLKKLRAKQGITQDDLARKANVEYTTLNKIESDVVKKLSVQTIARLTKASGVPMEDLLK